MSITTILLIVIVGASLYAWNKPEVMQKWMMNPYAVKHGRQYWRFITSGFIHSTTTHLLFNGLTLYFFGNVIEQYFLLYFGTFGQGLYLILFLAGVVVSEIPTYLKYRDRPHYNSLGASGGVSAVIFAAVMFNPVADICLYFILCLPGFVMALLYLAYSAYQSRQNSPGDNINHDAHLYGALFGIVFAIAAHPPVLADFLSQIGSYQWF